MDAILMLEESKQENILPVLVEELPTLERFQPRDPNINVSKVSSFEYYVRKLYRPKENIEHIYQLTALALIMSCDRRVANSLLRSPLFEKPLLSDIKYCLEKVNRIDPDFLRLGFRFTKVTLGRARLNDTFAKYRKEIQFLIAHHVCENAESIKLEDLAFISDVCRFEGFDQSMKKRYVEAMKPLVLEAWSSEEFKTKEAAVSIATKLAIATAAVHKYPTSEPELWGCIVEMLKWSLNAQSGESKLIPMNTFEFTRLIACLGQRQENDPELWGLLARVLVTLMNLKKLSIEDLMITTRSLVNAKVRSDKLYSFIVRYFTTLGFDDEQQEKIDPNVPIFFIFSLAKACPSLDANEEFFRTLNTYLLKKIA